MSFYQKNCDTKTFNRIDPGQYASGRNRIHHCHYYISQECPTIYLNEIYLFIRKTISFKWAILCHNRRIHCLYLTNLMVFSHNINLKL